MNLRKAGVAILFTGSLAVAQEPAAPVVPAVAPATDSVQAEASVVPEKTAEEAAPEAKTAEEVATAKEVVAEEVKEDTAAEAVAETTAEQTVETTAEQTVETPAEKTVETTAEVAPEVSNEATAPSEAVTAEETAAADSVKAEGSAALNNLEDKDELQSGLVLDSDLQGFLKPKKFPYIANTDITVAQGKALVIAPGVKILFAPGTGLHVQGGQIVVAGSETSPVYFGSALKNPSEGSWKGITLTGDANSQFRHVQIESAQAAIAVENGSLDLQNVNVQKSSDRGLYVRNGKSVVKDCKFSQNKGVALHAANYAQVKVERSEFANNQIGLLSDQVSAMEVNSSKILGNEVGLLKQDNSQVALRNTEIKDNAAGISSNEVVEKEIAAAVSNNKKDFSDNANGLSSTLPPSPVIPGVESRPLVVTDQVALLPKETADSAKAWTIAGTAMVGANYHYVTTRHNPGKGEQIGDDFIRHGDRYKNYFQVPGFGGEASAYVNAVSTDGKEFLFIADLTADQWNHFSPNLFTLGYKDNYNNVVAGDFSKLGGETYMSGLPLFGLDYTLSLLKNRSNQPLFELNVFGGEAEKPLLPGDRHPDIYNEYIEDGEAQGQRMVYGGSFKWNPVHRFDAKVGVLYEHDDIVDPLLRDGAHATTGDPLKDAFTVFAEGNWLFFPGDIQLNGQIAVGRADTANVVQERAVNQVFSKNGLSVSSYSTLRQLMQHPSKINALSKNELQAIFGEGCTLRESEMRKQLEEILAEAKTARKNAEKETTEDRVMGLDWGSQNFAIGASLFWNIKKTIIEGHIKYVGENFYSAGSADQLSDTREFGARLEQGINKAWTLNVGYQVNVENAAKDGKNNIFGFGEGTSWGFPEASDSWYQKHELDNDNARYIQNAKLGNNIRINDKLMLNANYEFEYIKQFRPTQLHANYVKEQGIYKDKWFKPRDGMSSISVTGTDYTVDEERWNEYKSYETDPLLASKFQERLFKNTWNLGASINAFNTSFKVDGFWTLRLDGSKFYRDERVKDWDLSNKTWGKLGYYKDGATYFEQRYPISAATTHEKFMNTAFVTPRFKSYERDDMKESEISLQDDFEMPFMNKFLVFQLSGQFRYMVTEWDDDGSMENREIDVLAETSLRINHNAHFYSRYKVGTGMFYRPDNLSDQYKDLYFGANLNYEF